ncbi:MAG TPA: permease, partial [Myxococcales bacterium]|nr:permease [Myxococcales bacterium]
MPEGAIARRPFDFRIPIAGLVIAGLCALFWVGSRYPALQGKASADPNEALSTPLGFERFFPEPPPEQIVKHIGWTAVEWALTNRQGMTFGLLLAAGMLTLVPLLRRSRGGRLAGAIQGMFIGAPLGVCVNCAAPIAQGMLKGGSRVETALAALFASPTFNVIVLGIVFAIFPWYLAIVKVVASLFIVLVIAPWLARLSGRPGWTRPQPVDARLPGLGFLQKLEGMLGTPMLAEGAKDDRPRGFFRALGWFLLRYPQNLLRVLLVALPLMLLAGVLGAVLVEVLPWNTLNHLT